MSSEPAASQTAGASHGSGERPASLRGHTLATFGANIMAAVLSLVNVLIVARTLGATPRQTWLHVLIPSALPLLRVCCFQTFLVSWVQYGLTLMIGSGKVRTLPLRVYDYAFEADPGYAAVAGLLLIVPPLTLAWMERRVLLKML